MVCVTGHTDLAIELGRGVPLGGLRATLAKALRDPAEVVGRTVVASIVTGQMRPGAVPRV